MSGKTLIPNLISTAIPENEQLATRRLYRSLQSLDQYIRTFQATLALFDLAHEKSFAAHFPESMTYSEWLHIACRDGALTVYHFGETLKHVRAAVKDAKSVAEVVDPNSLRVVTKKFEASFPDATALRHAIAHASDLWRDAFHYLKNAITGKVTSGTISISGTNVALQYALNQRRFCAIRNGRLACYEMSEQTLNSLIALKEEFYSAFRPAEQKLMALERASDTT